MAEQLPTIDRLNQDAMRTWQCGCLLHGGVVAADGRKARDYAERLNRIEGLCRRTQERWSGMVEPPGPQAEEFLQAVLGIACHQ